jgi:hypothetical protein
VRYTVLEVHDSAEERLLRLLDESSRGAELAADESSRGAELAAHLRDGWQGTPAAPGDTVHVLARVDVLPDGSRHALCDHAQGEIMACHMS